MSGQPVDPARITEYHIHVYYDPESRDRAALLREWVEERFPVRMGRWHDVPVGPHPTAMYQIQFMPDADFDPMEPSPISTRRSEPRVSKGD